MTVQKIARMELGENKCLDYSKKLSDELNKKGIQSSVIIGESDTTKDDPKFRHAWVAIFIEPQTGQFIKGYEPQELYHDN